MRCFFLHAGERGLDMLTGRLDIRHGRRLPSSEGFDAVIRFGTVAEAALVQGADGGRPIDEPVVFNRLTAVLRALKPERAREILSASGIKAGAAGRDKRVCEYEVPVFNLEALAVMERRVTLPGKAALIARESVEFREVPAERQTFHVRRAAREAVRAVYALGLDYGLVRLYTTSGGETVVTGVDPCPAMDTRVGERFADAINRFAAQDWPGPQHLLLGADPEFVLVKPDGRVVSASRFMDREGKVGSDGVVLNGHRTISPLAELRPDPDPHPLGLVRGLRRTMRLAARVIGDNGLMWRAGGMPVEGLPLGGHVHLSGVPLTGQLLRALDNYAALPLMLLEGEESRRRRPSYGKLGDFRRKRHGGFEYRTLPSWLASPELAAGVFSLVRVIALHWRELDRDALQQLEIRRMFYRGEPAKLRDTAFSYWCELERLPAYAEHRRELDWLKEAVFGQRRVDLSVDFRASWGMRPDGTFAEAAAEPVLP